MFVLHGIELFCIGFRGVVQIRGAIVLPCFLEVIEVLYIPMYSTIGSV